MQTRERLLAFLEENKGRYLSGEQIAQGAVGLACGGLEGRPGPAQRGL